PPWMVALEAIASLGDERAPAASERILWVVTRPVKDTAEFLMVVPRLQKARVKGGWSKGRAIALSTLWKQGLNGELEEADNRVVRTLRRERSWGREEYLFGPGLWSALVGHPRVVWHDMKPVEVVQGTPKLVVQACDAGWRIVLSPPPPGEASRWFVVREDTIAIYELTDTITPLAAALGPKGLVIPAEGESSMRAAVAKLGARVVVESDLEPEGEAETVLDADPTPVVQLRRRGEGLQVRLRVYPLSLEGAAYTPGQGRALLHTTREGQRVLYRRDLAAEASAAQTILRERLHLPDADVEPWTKFEIGRSLELLADLGEGADLAVVWPEGESLRVQRAARAPRLSMEVEQDWFAVDGTLELDEEEVLSLRLLLEFLPQRRGRFVPLDATRFVQLSEALLERLLLIRGTQHPDAKGIGISQLGAAALVTSTESPLKLDAKAKRRLARARAASRLQPEVPSTLEAELRPYQDFGFRWMSKLAHWGAGACLADDMGLGKTLQALAVLLSRAEDGPALVVAPSSVTGNWLDEAQRFAPALRMHEDPSHIAELGPFDVLVVSYSILSSRTKTIAARTWATAILDEAHAIKNPKTKRAQAAFALQASFRLAMTGTPVENHLGELWSLMRFLNPGLLGAARAFQRRYTASDTDHALTELRTIIAPFVLRRTKHQVLQELPPGTEVTQLVEPSASERAFWEALRRRAVERVQALEGDRGATAVTVLAELTRLRQAACAPQLVDPKVQIPSSKLTRFAELVQELIDGDHRMLVFSQFTSFLALAKDTLTAMGVTYQYLDGSMSKKARRQATDAFQKGSERAFLISLRAGGVGLNLTAADYVIHLDPWWNPAVEDQASDRAHRMGQTRAVTVVRLVTAGSIEQKVLELHQTKRDVAERLLAGTDKGATAPDLEALLAILHGEP
ncbi:MAG: DEAD/DEAH box helicase, partial [Myxococcota bacterium]